MDMLELYPQCTPTSRKPRMLAWSMCKPPLCWIAAKAMLHWTILLSLRVLFTFCIFFRLLVLLQGTPDAF